MRMRSSLLLLGIVAATLCLLPGVGSAQGSSVNVTILYTGDTHGHLRSFMYNSAKPVGGVAKRAIFFQEKRRHKNMIWLTLDAGDAITGTPLSEVFNGFLDIEAMNRLGYDAMALGIHEFDYGLDVLRQRMSEAKFPILSANVVYNDTGQPFATPYTIIERQGLKIGIFGLTSGDAAERIAPEHFSGLRVRDPLTVAGEVIATLKPQVDMLVALTHIGINQDIRLASQFQQIDVVVGGMSHSELQVPMRVERTLIVHDSMYGHSVGQLKLSYDRAGNQLSRRFFDCQLIPMDGKWAENSNYLAWLDSHNEAFQERLSRIVGNSSMRMSDMKIQSSETELGNYVCDILRSATGADAALVPAGFFQASLPEGPLTLGDLYAALPYDHYAEVVTLTGAQLNAALNNGADQIGRSGFPQLSGLFMGVFNGRAYNVRVNDRELDPYATYRVATTDMVANGGAGYPGFAAASARNYTGLRVRKLVERQLASGTTASASLSRRIQFLAQEPQVMASAPPVTPPPADSGRPVTTGSLGNESSDMPRYDRNGQPIGGRAVIEDELLTDQGGSSLPADSSGVEDVTDSQDEQAPEDSGNTLPDWYQPRSPGQLIGTATTAQDGLTYNFNLYRKENGKYIFVLEVINQTGAPVELAFETNERFDFRVSDEVNLRWNYNNNRFFVQSQQAETIDPGEQGKLELRSQEWDATDNTGMALPRRGYRFEAVYLLSGRPVQLSFEGTLE